MTISGPSRPRAHLGRFRGVPDGTSGGPPGETSKTINDTIQEHSFITSFFRLVVFGSLSSRCLWFSFVSFFFRSSPSIRFFCVQRSDQTCCRVQRSDQKIPIRPLDVLAGPSPVLGRRGRRASTVDARPLASDRRRIQKPARHRSRNENENFA